MQPEEQDPAHTWRATVQNSAPAGAALSSPRCSPPQAGKPWDEGA